HYIVHLSAGGTVPELRAARARGSRVVAETCPQYLVLDHHAYGAPGGDEPRARAAVMSPPLRAPEDQDVLWAALADGTISFVGTDHCSFTLAQKAAAADFSAVPNGAPGIELRLGLLYTHGVAAGRLTPERFVAVTSENAARYFGLYPRKGTLLPGSDADVVVYDPEPTWVVRHEELHDAAGHTPYEGLTIAGRVRDVFLRGHHLVDDYELVPEPPPAQFLRCGLPDGGVR
ncbi:MAG TPA: amidohydrolase family protein, partial [Candidatus Lustribacter sp.]|nr:amidohydrolase family protein [Candidatus Lustribacter sp.]